MKNIILAFFGMLSFCAFAQENHPNSETSQIEWSSSRPDGHAPISVMADQKC
ncbi:MAG TPA: hypothetical protein VFM82_00555 [Flavobacteriaceae bacterium]|nr:hypothetical protein [Flavobacteriaceae bacterium]